MFENTNTDNIENSNGDEMSREKKRNLKLVLKYGMDNDKHRLNKDSECEDLRSDDEGMH